MVAVASSSPDSMLCTSAWFTGCGSALASSGTCGRSSSEKSATTVSMSPLTTASACSWIWLRALASSMVRSLHVTAGGGRSALRALTSGFRSPVGLPGDAGRRCGSTRNTTNPGEPRRMCGIVGYVGHRDVRPLLLAGLEKLEYRGYDSAGISVLDGDRIDAVRAVGNLEKLREAIGSGGGGASANGRVPGTGIGHTRWATHGRVSEENAHPHFDTTDRVHVVVNGI